MPDSTVGLASPPIPTPLPNGSSRYLTHRRGKREITEDQLNRLFWAKISRSSSAECWEWTGRSLPNGYGQIRFADLDWYSHRVSYELHKGQIPEGLHVDHRCRNRACCNPNHLEAVTCGENIHRSPIAVAAVNARKTHCDRGHEYTEANTIRTKQGHRACRTCVRWRERVRHAERRGLPVEEAPPTTPVSSPTEGGQDACCRYGHPATEENTYVRSNGRRECRKCRAEQKLRWKAKPSDEPGCPSVSETTPTPAPGARRTIAVGILGRRAGRTVTTVRTASGVTGTIRRDEQMPTAPASAVTA